MPNEGIRIEVARPCPVKWGSMTGDERVRFCSLCRKSVYNLADLELGEVQELVREREGQVCVRFYQRADGTVLTADCLVGTRAAMRKLRRRLRRLTVGAMGFIGLIAGALGLEGRWLYRIFGAPMMGAIANTATPNTGAPRAAKVHIGIVDFASSETPKPR